MKAPDLNGLLSAFAWVRLGLIELIAILVWLMPSDLAPEKNKEILVPALVVAFASSVALLLVRPLADPRRMAWLTSSLDVVLITALVAATGGPRSVFPFLYVVSVTGSCLLLSRTGGLVTAVSSIALYAVLIFSSTVLPLIAFGEPPSPTTSREVLNFFLYAGTFLTVAIVSGGLAAQFHTTQEKLETQQKDLRDLQAFKNFVFDSVGTGLIALDRDHRITAFNRAAEMISGLSASQVLGRLWSTLFRSSVPLEKIEAAIADDPRAPSWHETVLQRPDGTLVPVRMTFSTLRAENDEPLGLISVCEDLSALRDMEARMRQADRLATVGRMAANIAHEIRNPLASLTGAIEALTGNLAAEEARDKLGQIVLRESERLNEIIKNFLEYARPAPLALDMVNVSESLDDVLSLIEHRARPVNFKIVREFEPSIRWRVDPQQFRQALWNLCLNAVEAMPEGGELRLGASIHRQNLEIWVSDTGEGIASGDVSHVFEPFFSTKPNGTGLGLALVHRIVQDHGGDIDVRSTPGFGTTFTMTLPANG